MIDLVDEILSEKNFIQALKELYAILIEKGKIGTYRGLSNQKFSDWSFQANHLIDSAKLELSELEPITPVIKNSIPKKRGGKRKIYIYNLKDRLKAQAIYRQVYPFFKKSYSPFLFSYREDKPDHYAARSVRRRYLRHYGHDWILVSDLKNYTENISHKKLLKKIEKIGFSAATIKLLKLFIKVETCELRSANNHNIRIIQGVPLINQYANLYLNDIDWYLGKKVSLYRRVGDDLILFDPSKEKIEQLADDLKLKLKQLDLILHDSKTKIIQSNEDFNFLGYEFSKQRALINKKTVAKFKLRVKKLIASARYFNSSRENHSKIISRLRRVCYKQPGSVISTYNHFLDQHQLCESDSQIKEISLEFFRDLTKLFFNHYSENNQRKVKKICQKFSFSFPSLYKQFLTKKHRL